MRKLTTSSTTTKPTTTSLWVTSTPKTGKDNASELGTGPYGLGIRNARGDSLINFAVRHQLKIMNTVFKKSANRRWTWISPNGHTKNEIDFILTNRPHTFTDVSVINSLNTGSDHRMVRGSLTINTKLERARLIQRCKKPNTGVLSANTTNTKCYSPTGSRP